MVDDVDLMLVGAALSGLSPSGHRPPKSMASDQPILELDGPVVVA
jgi:hypothetical protein